MQDKHKTIQFVAALTYSLLVIALLMLGMYLGILN